MSRSTDASIAFSVTDNLSASVVKMKNALGSFRDDAEGLQRQLDALQNTRMQLKNIDLKNAKSQVDQTRRALEELGESAAEADREAARADFDTAVQNYNNLENQLKLVSRQAKQTERDLLDATDAISKTDNRAASVSPGGGSRGSDSILSALGKAGLLNMAGDVALDAGNLLIGSGFGSEAGSVVSSGVSGALSGAAMGSLAGPIGTAVGAAIGGGLGLLQGGTQAAQARDEAFKQYYIDQYDQVSAATDESISGGGDTASQRELDAIAFNKLLYGQGDEFLKGLRATAAKTPFEYEDLTLMSRNLATGFGTDPDRMLKLMTAIGDAGASVGASDSDMQWMATALSRMQSTDLAQLGEINMFQDRGVDVIGMLANALGVSEGDVRSMISGGDISGRYAVDVIQSGLTDPNGVYAGSMSLMSETFSGLTSTLSDAMTEIDNAMGEGYNEKAKEGLQADIDAYGGDLGEAMAQANSIIGEGRAIAENLSRQYDREAMEALTMGADTTVYSDEQAANLQDMHDQYTSLVDQYQTATEEDKAVIAAQIEALMENAQAMAESNYNASDTAQQLRDVELDQIEAIRENTAALGNAAWSGDYDRQQEQSKGAYGDFWETGYIPGDISYNADLDPSLNQHAFGLTRVPYDRYPALLDEGERVLTAAQAREMDRPESLNVGGPVTAAEPGGISLPSYEGLMPTAVREPAAAEPKGDPVNHISVTVTGNTFGAGMDEAAVAEAIADTAVRKILAGYRG